MTSEPISVVGIHHVSLNVADVGEAVRFYVEVLGCRLLERPDFGFDGAWLAAGAHQIHLMHADAPSIDPRQHVALQVADLDVWTRELDARTVPYRRSPDVPGAGRQVFLRDPSGNRIELNEPGR